MTPVNERLDKDANGRIFGWISGLGVVFVPWLAAGILSTLAGMFSERLNPETTFPVILAGSTAAMVAWLIYGVVRIPGFRKGAARGSLLAVAIAVVLYGLILLAQPG